MVLSLVGWGSSMVLQGNMSGLQRDPAILGKPPPRVNSHRSRRQVRAGLPAPDVWHLAYSLVGVIA
jgi:hypothetical protein